MGGLGVREEPWKKKLEKNLASTNYIGLDNRLKPKRTSYNAHIMSSFDMKELCKTKWILDLNKCFLFLIFLLSCFPFNRLINICTGIVSFAQFIPDIVKNVTPLIEVMCDTDFYKFITVNVMNSF